MSLRILFISLAIFLIIKSSHCQSDNSTNTTTPITSSSTEIVSNNSTQTTTLTSNQSITTTEVLNSTLTFNTTDSTQTTPTTTLANTTLINITTKNDATTTLMPTTTNVITTINITVPVTTLNTTLTPEPIEAKNTSVTIGVLVAFSAAGIIIVSVVLFIVWRHSKRHPQNTYVTLADKMGSRSTVVNSDQEIGYNNDTGNNRPTTSGTESQQRGANQYINQAFDLQENKLSQQSNNNKNIKFRFDDIKLKKDELSETSF